MKNILRLVLCSILLGVTVAGAGACASSGGASKPTGPVELDGSRWKLVVAGGKMDGRVVEFKKRGDGYVGVLVEPGMQLRNATGVDVGTLNLFSLKPKGVNEYAGVYKAVASDGSVIDKEVNVFIDGDNLTWNLESATWERQN
jgi:hypothetical protein